RNQGGERPDPSRKKGGHAGRRQSAQPSDALPDRDDHSVDRTGGPPPLRRLQPPERMGQAQGRPGGHYANISRMVQNSSPQDERGSSTRLVKLGTRLRRFRGTQFLTRFEQTSR